MEELTFVGNIGVVLGQISFIYTPWRFAIKRLYNMLEKNVGRIKR